MSTNKASSTFPVQDPYDVLGLKFGASDTDIAKAYRTLARTLHPDKLVAQHLSQTQLNQAATRFQEIQIARSFLLDDENIDVRRKYDSKLASDHVRRATDKAREVGMSERRKRMRDELQQYEAQEVARKNDGRKAHTQQSSTATQHQQHQQHQHRDAKKTKLAKEGIQMKERYAAKEEMMKEQERAQAVLTLQNRQIRLKWSRKKLKAANIPSPSEDSIAAMLSESSSGSGTVERVQMLGDLGNAALVTFHNELSCDIVVMYYRTSELYRAVHVNKAKQRMVDERVVDTSVRQRDHEDVNEWKERQARERELLLQQMEEEDQNVSTGSLKVTQTASPPRTTTTTTPSLSDPFPPSFPKEYLSFMNGTINPLNTLEGIENILLKDIISDKMLQQMKVHR